VDPALIAIIMLIESGGATGAKSPGAGALGVMQIHPPSWPEFDVSRAADPAYNIDFGARVLADCLRRYGGPSEGEPWESSVDRASACYNGGSPSNRSAETTAHRRWVGGMYRERNDPMSLTLDAWKAMGGGRLLDAAGARR